MTNRIRALATASVLGGLLAASAPSQAIVTFGDDVEVEGFLQSQNVLRTPRMSDSEWIMQRNTAQIEGKYYFLKDSTAFGKFDTGPLEEATFSFIGRAVYDSIYDIRGRLNRAYDKQDNTPGDAEVKMREAFVDLLLPPVSLRIGRQQVVWGETDNFRALDVINPLDLSWHWTYESWEDIRIPLWMTRAVYDIGKVGPFEESFVEAIWIPWDVKSNRVATDPRQPWAFLPTGLRETPNSAIIGGQLYNLDLNVIDGAPDRRVSNSQGGFRFKGVWGDIDFSLNYFYGFSADTRARMRNDLFRLDPATAHVTAETRNPRSHVIGFTANYSEEKYTQAVFRLETTFTTGVPISVSPDAPLKDDPNRDQFETARRSVVMMAVDRPTWVHWLNDQRTIFFTSQVFWRRWLDYSEYFRGIPAVRQAEIGGIPVPGRFVSVANDKIDRDEFVMTFSASTSYGDAGLLQPRFVFAMDPRSTGAYNQFSVDYLWSNHVTLRFQENLFWRVSGHDAGPWGLGDIWGNSEGQSRHESVFSLIYNF